MKILDAVAIYYALTKSHKVACASDTPYAITKVAFDTRRIDQETEYNPRRGLQYYHRSEGFIQKDAAAMVKTFGKLKGVVDQIKGKYLGNPQWFDSYCRVLSASLDRVLRADQKDTEYFQPHLDYLEELLDLRYRLKLNDIESFAEEKLHDLILQKDEKLSNAIINNPILKDSNEPENGLNVLLAQLLGTVKATGNDKSVERSITITIRDTVLDKIVK